MGGRGQVIYYDSNPKANTNAVELDRFNLDMRKMSCSCMSLDPGYCVHQYIFVIIATKGDLQYYGMCATSLN